MRVATRRIPATSRNALRTSRISRRYQSSLTPNTPQGAGAASGALSGGLAGGVVVALIGYGWYYFSGTRTLVTSVQSSKDYVDNAFKQLTDKAPQPNEAVRWLRSTVTGYTQFIPGANQYVDQAFKDVEKVQEKHGQEVEKIIQETYDELKGVTKAGVSVAAASQAWDVLQNALKKIGHLAGDAAEDILNNHPQLKEKVGGQYKQLQQMGSQFGPEAKKQVEETWKQVQDIIKGGLSADNIQKAQKLIEEKVQQVKKLGDKAWDEGLKQAQPILDKNPELKDLVNKNKDKLLQGDMGQLWKKVQDAASSGNTDDVKKFVSDQVDKGKQSGGAGIESLLSMFPGGKDIGSKLSQLQELSEKHGKEAEKLVKSTFDDIKKVLDKKMEEGKELKNKAEKDAKS